MIGKVLYYLFGKHIILFSNHRQIEPLRRNRYNRKRYLFLSYKKIFNLIPFRSSSKVKYRIIYFILTCINPKYILGINWIGRESRIFKLWTRKNSGSKSIVIQHGAYVGGIVTDKPHRFAICDVFFVWGHYFLEVFQGYNSHKKVEILNFGNPIYNEYNRDEFEYSNLRLNRILIAPSGIKNQRLQNLYQLIDKLEFLGFEVYIKEHKFQTSRFEKIEFDKVVLNNTYDLLEKQSYDIIIADHGTMFLDAVFFKNRVVYFSSPGELPENYDNFYTKNVKNLYNYLDDINTKEGLYDFVDLSSQEDLFSSMIFLGTNEINFH